jgi:hypothetical protein
MRPVLKGAAPRTYAHWGDARDDLADAVGNYCSYCESPPFLADVEHKEPKADPKYSHRALEWDNFLLACGYCNSLKRAKDTRARPVLFPDEKNTAWAFVYLPNGVIQVNPNLKDPSEHTAATDTRDWLLELNRPIDTKGNRDLRWQRRVDVWREAQSAKQNLADCNMPAMYKQIVSAALGWGCFSVWMAAFEGDQDMRRMLVEAFATVRSSCYDAGLNCVQNLDI